MTNTSIGLALVIDKDSDIQVIDIEKIQSISPTIYIIETKPFNNIVLENGAGEYFSKETIQTIIKSLKSLKILTPK